jgi:tRNA pseudouridine38-40 synthase
VSCWRAAIVDPVFDPRHQPHTKLYRFRFLDRRAPSPLRRGRVWHVRHHLDADAMHSAVLPLVGTLDFSSFRATGCASAHPVRTIKSCEVVRRGDEVHLMVEGTGFLRHMVRILAGTLYEVGAERRPSSWVREVVDQRSRIAAGRTAPPGGLCLVSVRYHAQTTERG